MLSQPIDELKELLDREKEFRYLSLIQRLKNKQITSKVTKAFENAEKAMKEGASALIKPVVVEKNVGTVRKPKKVVSAKPEIPVEQGAIPNEQSVLQVDEALGTEATLRLLKAKLHVLQQELQVLANEKAEKEKSLAVVEEKFKTLAIEKSKDDRQIGVLQTQNEKIKKQFDDVSLKYQACDAELQRLRREKENATKLSKQSEQDTHSKDLRLNRCVDELEKLKTLMASREAEFKDRLDAGKKIADDLFAENKRLQMQKNELINGFKKQGQLVEILKRQKMHIEAAKLLEISEEQFVRSLK